MPEGQRACWGPKLQQLHLAPSVVCAAEQLLMASWNRGLPRGPSSDVVHRLHQRHTCSSICRPCRSGLPAPVCVSCALQDFNRTKPAKNLPRELCYGPQDFRIGTYVQVYGRDFLVHDCDDFTRHWYQVGTQAADLQPGAASRALCMVLHTRLADTQQVCLDLTMVMLR